MQRRTFLKGAMAAGGCAICASMARASGEVPWGYSGNRGAEEWGHLSAGYRSCSTGVQQSPINITGAISARLEPLELDWKTSPAEIVNNGHTIQLNVPAGSTLKHDGRVYELLQFHFHAPSEHQIDGRSFPMEIHFVHRHAASGNLAVIGVLVMQGERNIPFAQLAAIFPKQAEKKEKLKKADPSRLLPAGLEYFAYEGSLTTPPCSEIVTWLVLTRPLIAGKSDIRRFTRLYRANARPIMPTNRRLILRSR